MWRQLDTIWQYFQHWAQQQPQRVHDYLAQRFQLRQVGTDLSYHGLRLWRTLHHLAKLAAAQTDAEFFGTRVAAHRDAYHTLRRTMHASVTAGAVDSEAQAPARRTRSKGNAAEVSADLSTSEQRQINSVFSAAWRQAQRHGDGWSYGTPPPSIASMVGVKPRSPTATKRRIVTEQPSRSSS